MRCVRLHCRMA